MTEENKMIKVIANLSKGAEDLLEKNAYKYFERQDEGNLDEYYFLPYVYKKSDLREGSWEVIRIDEIILPVEIKKYLKELINP